MSVNAFARTHISTDPQRAHSPRASRSLPPAAALTARAGAAMAIGSMASPPPRGDGDGEVCCMCGDQGLPHELLRCRSCRVRLQHRYCSDLYPRATAYRRCNWCLREPAGAEGGGGGHAHAAAATKATGKRKAVASTVSTTSTSEEEERQRHEAAGCSTSRSRRPAAEVGRPVKKQKYSDERVAVLPPAAGAAKGSNGNSNKKPMQAAGKLTRPGRVKVRRYKPLAEVISC